MRDRIRRLVRLAPVAAVARLGSRLRGAAGGAAAAARVAVPDPAVARIARAGDALGRRFPAVSLAFRNLSRQRLRAGLAALGIVIGVFAVVALGMLGTALQTAATEELGGLGDQVIVSPAAESGEETLDGRDLAAVERAAAGRGTVIPLKSTGGTVSAGGSRTVAQVYGTTNPRPLFGDAPGVPDYHRQGALVGADVAGALDLRVGSQVTIESNTYRVVAVLPPQSSITPLRADSAVVLPPGEFATDGFSQVVVQADSGGDADAVARGVRDRLNARERRVSVFSLTSVLDRITEFFALLNGFLLAVAGVSLVVAGVSIFNVMLMTVSERRGEIGVLRAVGIHRDQVLRTLLVEATLLGVGGGAVGVLLGTVGVVIVALNTELPLDAVLVPTNALVALGAFAFGVAVALVGGLYPAYRAAWEPPVQSLRG
ncbi:FtsX-like permease family protein [Halobaculum sp. WSA2]|uniref:FtsX-like permease family protein n=1 Tax=Halobaculum saliterrae TaxID=2073113 RepID=A0A6B0STX6_9EURY|nr:ABC transporter permease [Halobaculum saliterrae]MXR40131.1 FtsX-like permease family protein [Halobaculum saliterrae]